MKNFIYIISAFAALALTSCSKEQEVVVPEIPKEGIILHLLPGGVEVTTKTTPNSDSTRPGDWDGEFNENYLGTEVDVFFFPADATETTYSIYNNRFTINNSGYVQVPVSQDKLNSIFGADVMNAEAKVVVVANFNGTPFDHENRAYSLSEIKAMDLATANWKTFPQSSFVMISTDQNNSGSPFYPIVITRPGQLSPASATIPMKRIAAKISFRLTIAQEIKVVNITRDAEGNIIDRDLETWTPQMDAVTAYLQYAMKLGTLGGTPQAPPATVPLSSVPESHESLMAYDQRNIYKTEDVISRTRIPITGLDRTVEPPVPVYGDAVTSDFPVYEVKKPGTENISGPFYTYPITWNEGAAGEPFIKLIIPWKSGNRVKYYYYKVPFREAPLESNHWYEVTLDVQILGGEDQAPLPLEASYQVVSWERGTMVDVETSVSTPRYLSASITEFIMYNQEELIIPITSSHDVQIVGYQVKSGASSGTDRASGKAFTSGDKALKPTAWIGSNPSIYNPFSETLYSIDEETVVGTVKITKPDYNHWTTGNPYPATSDAASLFPATMTVNGETVDAITRDQIYFHHQLNNDTDTDDYDIAPYYVRFRVQHKDDPSFYKDFIIEQRPAIIIEPELNSDGTDENHRGYVLIDNLNSNSSNTAAWKRNSTLTGENNANPNMYVITTGVLSSSTDVIGDPRELNVFADNNLYSGWESTASAFVDGTTGHRLTNYYPTYEDTNYANIIAPSFRVASSYGKSQAMSYDDAQRRCASYQEDGYPAGRWRIPTKAEVIYMTKLSHDGKIPELFTFAATGRDPSYWCASGVIDGYNGAPTYYEGVSSASYNGNNNNYTNKRHVRCVYDEWFWKDTKYARVTPLTTFKWGDQPRNAVTK